MEIKVNRNEKLKVICLEDEPRDVEIMREVILDAGYDLNMDSTAVEKEFISFLRSRTHDIILADFKLPGFDAFAALRWTMEICPNIPFICVSGSIGEEAAIELLKLGAVDYVLKDRLERLPSAIQRALDEAKGKDARKRAEDALRESESQFHELWEATVEGITILDKGIIVEANNAMCQIFGYTREYVIGKSLLEFTPPEMHDRIRERIALGIEGRFETPALRSDGAKIILEAFAKQFVYQGKSMRLVATRDITERKKAENDIAISEERYRRLFETAQDGILILDASTGMIVDVNPFLVKMLGFTR